MSLLRSNHFSLFLCPPRNMEEALLTCNKESLGYLELLGQLSLLRRPEFIMWIMINLSQIYITRCWTLWKTDGVHFEHCVLWWPEAVAVGRIQANDMAQELAFLERFPILACFGARMIPPNGLVTLFWLCNFLEQGLWKIFVRTTSLALYWSPWAPSQKVLILIVIFLRMFLNR